MTGMLQRPGSTKTHPSSVHFIIIFIKFQVPVIIVLKLMIYIYLFKRVSLGTSDHLPQAIAVCETFTQIF